MKKEYKVILGVSIFMLIIWLLFDYLPNRELQKNPRFTIGIIREIRTLSEGPKSCSFDYMVGKSFYNGVFSLRQDSKIKYKCGGRVYVKFQKSNPGNSQIEYNVIVPDSIESPTFGWKKLPL